MTADMRMQDFISEFTSKLAPLAREAAHARWQHQTEGGEVAEKRAAECGARVAELFADPAKYAELRAIDASELTDPYLARQHKILSLRFLTGQLDPETIKKMSAMTAELSGAYNSFRANLAGELVTDNQLDHVLLHASESDYRKQAWEASKLVGAENASRILQLVKLRNREAHRMGFRDYYEMSLTTQEIDESYLFSILHDLEEETRPLWNRFRLTLDEKIASQFNSTTDQIRPWHHSNRFFQTVGSSEESEDDLFKSINVEEVTRRYFQQIGLPVDDLLSHSDLYERPGKCQHAFCMNMDREGDVRVLCNLQPCKRWMTTNLHEYGHAVYEKYVDQSLPYLLRTCSHTMTTESIALMMGRLTDDVRWLIEFTDANPSEATEIANRSRKAQLEHQLVFMHWCFVMVNFEKELYANPDQNLNTLWWDLVEKYQLVIRPEGRNAPDWASKIHVASSPVYYHNYLLGDMMTSQLMDTIENEALKLIDKADRISTHAFGTFLKDEVFAPGASVNWQEWLQHCTGRSLSPTAYVREIEVMEHL